MRYKARDLAMELENIIMKIDESYEDSKREMQRLDMMREDILHHIEGTSFNASEGYKYSKALQLVSQERRENKYEYEELQSLRARVRQHSEQLLKSTEHIKKYSECNDRKKEKGYKQYKPRVLRSLDENDVLNQVLEILNSGD